MRPGGDLANTELVLLAMLLAGAGEDFTDIEDIAVEAHRLSPQRFGWRTKPYPSDKIVVQAVADLEAKHKDRLTLRGAGNVATRMLTADGRKAAVAAGKKVAGRDFDDASSLVSHFRSSDQDAPAPAPAERRRVQAELGELRRHRVFQVWVDEGGDLSTLERWELLDALSCLPDAPVWGVRQQVENLTSLAERWSDDEAIQFLNDISTVAAADGG
jgi:hypothetical protein